MSRPLTFALICVTIGCIVISLPACAYADSEGVAYFEKEVLPILKANCYSCHGGEKVKGEFRINDRESMVKGGESGDPGFDTQSPEASILLAAVKYDGLEMPPKGKLASSQIAKIEKWIKLGAPYPEDMLKASAESHKAGPPQVTEQAKQWWSFQPVQRPVVPAVKDSSLVGNAIDAFIVNKLEQNSLAPAAEADKVALVRRAFYDLIGLPPSPAQVEEFVKDTSAQAWPKLIDRLMESPHYGEKWGRHWLDLVRFAESNSYERDGTKPYVWRYRDYVIESFNKDKPYSRFVMEQLAGDELPDSDGDAIIATGYYRLGTWQDEPVDRLESLYNDLDDLVVTTSETFLGLTVGCARCHDHKIDPIPQKDYYRMLSFFRNVRRFGDRGNGSVLDASVKQVDKPENKDLYAKQIREHEQNLKNRERDLNKLEAKVRDEFSGVEKEDFQYEMNRIAIMKKHIGDKLNDKGFQRYKKLTKERDNFRANKPKGFALALCVKEFGRKAPVTTVLARGNAHAPAEEVQPGFPLVLSPPEPQLAPAKDGLESTGRRLALAKWIASDRNPLTARVIVNRLWQHHFGRGIVQSASDFGYQGTPPSHPELLDWLSAEFMDGGWTFKRMHKLIMMSKTYRMSSNPTSDMIAKDEANELFSRFDMRRLTAEEVRDSILTVNGTLLLEKMFGPSIYPTLPPEVLHGQSRPGAGWETSPPDQQARRAIYIFVKRSLSVPMMASFDMADSDKTCPVRFVTTQPTQALGMLNSDFLQKQATEFANYVKREAGDDPADQIALALSRATQRKPSDAEVKQGVELYKIFQKEDGASSDDALKYFCLLTLNLNEFMYLD